MKNRTYNKKKITLVFLIFVVILFFLITRLIYLMIFDAGYYQEKAEILHDRERKIKAARGEIVDRNGKILATNKTVCTISVIHSQIKEKEKVINILSKELEMKESDIRKRVEKVSSMERIKTNVDKEKGDKIREYHLAGVKVDEDFKRYYPYDELASKVLGFTGSDNQGIIGLEVKYEKYLKGQDGMILTTTDARGVELEEMPEKRVEPLSGNTLKVSLDYNIQKYAQQAAKKLLKEKQADQVLALVMNPKNGEILAMVNVPEFDLNHPFKLKQAEEVPLEKRQDLLNEMWRNGCINDTYEPGSTFKIITSALCLENKVVDLKDQFHCPGYRIVDGRRIRCHKFGGHGTETFVEGVQNSCNPVFIDIGTRLGTDRFYEGFYKIGLMEKTGIDLPGEAGTIMHKKEKIGPVELATISFGQSFQITPVQLAATVGTIINGGKRTVPHLGVSVYNEKGKEVKKFQYPKKELISEKTSSQMKMILESVVSEGSGKKGALEGYRIGGKTATSQTLPRSAHRYISSFIGFAPADDPEVLALVIVHDPKGIYYGGAIAAPVVKDLFSNILPYLGIEKDKAEQLKNTEN